MRTAVSAEEAMPSAAALAPLFHVVLQPCFDKKIEGMRPAYEGQARAAAEDCGAENRPTS